MTWSSQTPRVAAVALLLLMGCGSPPPPVMPAPEPEPEVEVAPEPRVRTQIPIEDRIRAPFAVQSDGRSAPRQPRQDVVVLEEAPARPAAVAARDTARRDTAAAPPAGRTAAAAPGGNGAQAQRPATGAAGTQRPAAPAQGTAPARTGTPATPAAPRPSAPREHTVAVGETFYSIARRYSVTPSALSAVNPGVDTERLRSGQVLQLPAYASRPDTADGAEPRADAPRAEAPPAQTPRATTPAQPTRTTPPPAQRTPPPAQRTPAARTPQRRTHTVASGETLWSISRRYGVSPEQIRTANRMSSDLVRIGQTLVIP
jgi:membrane-bound lytic murein transglycosylase D